MFSQRHCGPTLPDQVEGLPERFHPAATLELVEPEGREAELDAFFAAIPVNLRHQGSEAYYEPTADRVTMPPTSLFSGFDHYYATLAHEVCNIASVLISRTVDGLLTLVARHHRRACLAMSGRES